MVLDQPSQDEPHPSSIRHCVVFGIGKLIGSLRISTISEKNDPEIVLKSIHQCVEQARFETETHGKQGIYAAVSQRLIEVGPDEATLTSLTDYEVSLPRLDAIGPTRHRRRRNTGPRRPSSSLVVKLVDHVLRPVRPGSIVQIDGLIPTERQAANAGAMRDAITALQAGPQSPSQSISTNPVFSGSIRRAVNADSWTWSPVNRTGSCSIM